MIIKNIFNKFRSNIVLVMIGCVAFLLGMLLFFLFLDDKAQDKDFLLREDVQAQIKAFRNSNIVKKNHVPVKKQDDLINYALFYHMLKKYQDQHSTYFNQDMLERFNQSLNSKFVGIGIESLQTKEGLVVKRVFENTPAKLSGLKEDDLIVGTNKIDFLKNSDKNWSEFIKGEASSNVLLKIKRQGQDLELNVKRKQLTIPQVEEQLFNNNQDLYLKIISFGDNVGQEFTNSLKKGVKENTKNLIIDLRGNGGGSLEEVKKIISLFVKDHTKILLRKTLKSQEYDYSFTTTTKYNNLKVKILIDEQSASASEILALSLRELIHANLYGTKSFGKGSVQRMYTISQSQAFKLTIEKWFSPSGVAIDHIGINPDVVLKNDDNWKQLPYSKLIQNDKVLNYVLGESNGK